ncbi:transglycosylase SLT domain-containing protein [Longimicrobium terrae]|uniref:Soluble lytic murein transglycosylase n=1 Tax=Longimicrobium terrae TaxID=1639882 RepID=A0A841H3J4_9BACT|nr:transglycosylase SLT domain-containing protein [Longimicrobium terrae]MBB4638325.1 soluble lytic murein transglycosylase [Longimicrobium terrae]MBB6072607.1 soluble lytic murein transglycosylase [Longimicrobium terrae]NNC28614.1 transglycosylase SLT domain-containing protein [Longimicrobium terrae]
MRLTRQQQILIGLAVLLIPVLIWAATRKGGENTPRVVHETPRAPASVQAARGPDLPDEIEKLLGEGRNWRAARRLRAMTGPQTDPAVIVVAAKAEAGWGGWNNVIDLLEGKPWLDRTAGGDGWYLLGRAREHARRWNDAAEAYGKYVALRPEGGDAAARGERTVGELRYALALLRAGRTDEGVRALEHARAGVPVISGWVSILAAEAVAERGDTARVRAFLPKPEEAPSPARARRAWLDAYGAARDSAGARTLALRFREAAKDTAGRAEMSVAAARVVDAASAVPLLRSVLAEAPTSGAAVEAARRLGALPGITPADRLAIATVYDRAGNKARAADGYRAWLAANPNATDVRLRLVRALFGAGRFADVDAAAAPLLGGPPPIAAEAMYIVGRAQYRRGDRTRARQTWNTAATRFRGVPAAGEAAFMLGDLSHDAGDDAAARAGYRRTADGFPGTPSAGIALMRLGGMAYVARDYAGAARIFDEYRTRNAGGEYWAQATYWAGRARVAAGKADEAAPLFQSVRQREPLSYYALQSAERLKQPFWPVELKPDPAPEPAATNRVTEWLYGVDLLRAAGLDTEAAAEVDRLVRAAGDERAVLYPLAEGINERGYTSQGIRAGLSMQKAGEPNSARLLRILHPLPYRGVIEGEARAAGLEPAQVAAMIRQESWFNARAQSGPGARGLMQVMPETGRGLARGLDIQQWEPELLFNPELNVAMGVRYLADQMRAYRRSLPSVYAAYNAGPVRVERWRALPEYRDEELFTERIPYVETRDYVKILTRNTAVYRGLYGAGTARSRE